jgi:hypothetical protein
MRPLCCFGSFGSVFCTRRHKSATPINVCRSPAARASHDATEREGHARAGPGAVRCSGRLAFVICATTISNPAILIFRLPRRRPPHRPVRVPLPIQCGQSDQATLVSLFDCQNRQGLDENRVPVSGLATLPCVRAIGAKAGSRTTDDRRSIPERP